MNEASNNNSDMSAVIEEMQGIREGINANSERLNEIGDYLVIMDDKNNESFASLQENEESNNVTADTEYIETLLLDIKTEIQLTNQILSGTIIFYGIIAGIILFKILWDKLT